MFCIVVLLKLTHCDQIQRKLMVIYVATAKLSFLAKLDDISFQVLTSHFFGETLSSVHSVTSLPQARPSKNSA